MLLDTFGEPGWERFDEAVDRGELGLREAGDHQVAMLRGSREEMLAFALSRVRSSRRASRRSSDGPRSETCRWCSRPTGSRSTSARSWRRPASGTWRWSPTSSSSRTRHPPTRHPNGHPVCTGCGTCKMLAAQRLRERHGPIAFVGDGQSDRYGALYSDIVFAKDALVPICELDGVPFRPMGDVRRRAATRSKMPRRLPGPVGGERCPGLANRVTVPLPEGLTHRSGDRGGRGPSTS